MTLRFTVKHLTTATQHVPLQKETSASRRRGDSPEDGVAVAPGMVLLKRDVLCPRLATDPDQCQQVRCIELADLRGERPVCSTQTNASPFGWFCKLGLFFASVLMIKALLRGGLCM